MNGKERLEMVRNDLLAAIGEIPVIDVHSHLRRDGMAAGTLDKVIFYHMLLYPLRSAGADEKKLWAENGNFHSFVCPRDEWLKYWPSVQNTGFGWILKSILRDLYDWDEPITAASLPQLEEQFNARIAQSDWAEQVLRKGKIARVMSSSCLLYT